MSTGIAQSRWAKWVAVSHAIDPLALTLKDFAQGLGKLDSELVEREMAYLAMTTEQQTTYSTEMNLNDLVMQSALWTLGAYEVMRTIAQRAGSHATFLDDALRQRVKQVKIEFERVRIPLAKVEKAENWPADSGVALPALNRTKGIAWIVGNSTYVTRRDLSDSFLDLLTAISAYRERP